jgi:hypothetical protein
VVLLGLLLVDLSARCTSGGSLVVLTLSLVVFALNVSVLIAFTVARYEDPESADDLHPAA